MSMIDGLQQNANATGSLLDLSGSMVPTPGQDGFAKEDMELISSLLRDLSRWMISKQGPASDSADGNAQFPTNPDQIWRGNLMPRDPTDPMGNFIAKIGEA